MTRTGDRHVFGSSTDNSFSIFPPRSSDSLDGNVQPSHAKTQSFGFVQVGGEQSGLRDNQLFSFYASNKNHNSPGELWGSAGQSETVQRLNSLGQTPNQVDRSPGTHGSGRGPEAEPGLSHDGSSVGRMETLHSVSQFNSAGFNTEDRTGYQLLSHDQTGSHQYDPFQMGNMPTSQLRPIQQTPLHYGPYQISSGTLSDAAVSNVRVPSRDKKYVPVAPEYNTSKNSDVQTVPDRSGDTQGSRTSQENFQGVAHSIKIQGRPSQHIEPISNEPSPQSSRVDHNPVRPGPSEQKNDQPVQPSAQTRRPHSIRVKPPSMFAPSGEDLHQQSIIQHGGSQSYTIRQAPDSQNTNGKPATGPTGTNDKYQHPAQSVNGDTNLNPVTLQHGTGRYEGLQSVRELPIGQNSKPPAELPAVSSEGKRPTSRPAAGLSASNIREEYKPEKTSLFQQLVQPALKQERGSHSVRVKPDPSASHQSSSQYGHGSELTQQKLLQSVTERRNSGQQSASSQQMASHIRVRPASSQQPGSSGSSSSPGRPQVPDQLDLQSAQNTANVPQEDPRQYGAEPGQQVPPIQPDSSQRRATLTVRVKPDPSPGNTIQQSFNQYRDLLSSESEQEPWRNILHPAAAAQDVAAPEPATVHYQTPPRQRKPPPNKRTPQTIRVRPGNNVLQVQNQFVNPKREAVRPSDGGSAAEPDPGRISILHPGPEGGVRPNAILLSGAFQKPPNRQLSQHGRPDKHPTGPRDQSHMTDGSFSTIKLDQNPVDDISSDPVENAESNPYEKFSNNGSPPSFVKVSSSLTRRVGNPRPVSQNSRYSSQTNEADDPGEYHQDPNPSEDPGASPGTRTASDGSGSVLPIQRSSDCSGSGGSAPFLPAVTGHFGASVHQGIVRGKQNR
ncbi:uncharacterized protein [Centroberyx affinis]|uniref:uncharacterized protein n=1 Tax=Centroberyx affinis TaxID=166261 RepID=UPI003A5BB3F3